MLRLLLGIIIIIIINNIIIIITIIIIIIISLVGRADCLCGLLYALAIKIYIKAIRTNTNNAATTSTTTTTSTNMKTLKLILIICSHILGLLATLAKEIGATIFGVFIIIELIEILRSLYGTSVNKKNVKSIPKTIYILLVHFTRSYYIIIRCILSVLILVVFGYYRVQLNGQHKLYSWTIMENHINLLQSFKERMLSYAQSHFWYVFKLFFPRYLCFDYGFACIPTIHTYDDVRNIFPVVSYSMIILLALHALNTISIPIMYGMMLVIIPLIPALNILFPVGTILAERLLFIPSIGFTLIMGEILTVYLGSVWLYIGRYELTIIKGMNSMLLFLVPLLALSSMRVVTRNGDWNSELKIYKSALDVCPHSIKALSNLASLSLGEGHYDYAADLANFAITIHDELTPPYVNGGVAYHRKGDYAKSIHFFQRSLDINYIESKSYGYLGSALLEWSRYQPRDIAIDMMIRATRYLDKGMLLHFAPPSMIHQRGSAALELGYYEQAKLYFLEVIRVTEVQKSFGQDVPIMDGVEIINTYIQLGNAFSKLNEYDKAIEAYRTSIKLDPTVLASYINIGNAYKVLKDYDQAEDIYVKALTMLEAQSPLSSSASVLYNNLGLLLLERNQYQRAKDLFVKALSLLSDDNDDIKNSRRYIAEDSIENVISINIERANVGLRSEL